MQINTVGEYVGNEQQYFPIHLNDTPIALPLPGISPRWLTETVFVFRGHGPSGWRLFQYDRATAVITEISSEASFVYAGGGQWATYLAASTPRYVDSYGTSRADWVPLAVDDVTGHVYVIPNLQSLGIARWDGQTLTPYATAIVRSRDWVCRRGVLHPFPHSGTGWRLDWVEGTGLILREIVGARGVLVSPRPRNFYPAVYHDLATDQLLVVASDTQGDTRPVHTYRFTANAIGVWAPSVPPPPPVTVPLDDPCRVHACFMDGYQQGLPPRRYWLGGTVGWGAPLSDQRLVYGDYTESPTWGLVIGTEGTPSALYIARSLDAAAARHLGVVVYSDARVFTTTAMTIFLRAKARGLRTYRGIQAYGGADETPEQTVDRVERLVEDAKDDADRVVIISRADSPYARPLIPFLHKLINRKYPGTIVGHGVFGCARPGQDPVVVSTWASIWATAPAGAVARL